MSAAPVIPQEQQPQAKNTLALVKTEVVEKTAAQIRTFIDKGQLTLPSDYSVENALKAAWLVLQEVVDKDKRPALEVCTKSSIVNALMAMVVQGLDPLKKQNYFIVYGKSLSCQRSYFGEMAVAQRVRPGIEFGYRCWYEGDEIGYDIVNGKIASVVHKQDVANVRLDNIAGAYCIVTEEATGKVVACEVMPIDRIKRSWSKSKTYNNPNIKDKTHDEFEDEMAVRTVVRKVCKPIINSSSDALLLQHARQQEIDATDAEIADEALELGNQELLSLPEDTESAVEVPADHIAVPRAEVEAAMAALEPQPTLHGAGGAEDSAPY